VSLNLKYVGLCEPEFEVLIILTI